MLQVILAVILCVFLIFKNLVPQKRQVLEWKINVHLDLYDIQFYVVIVFYLVKQSAKPLGFLLKETRKYCLKSINIYYAGE